MYQQTIRLLIDILHALYQLVLELGIEKSRIKYKELVLLQELYGEWFAISLSHHITLNLIDGKQTYPFFTLGFVGNNLRIEFLRHTIKGYTVITLHNKLFLQPQFLLEVLQLC